MDDWAEMLDRPDLDIIWIGTPPVLHAPITISALEAGKHVFCQARMAMNLREGREMLAAAQARPATCDDALPAAARHEGRKIFPETPAGRLRGRALAFPARAPTTDKFSDPLAPAHWRQRTELSGLNVLTVGIYAEVVQRWLGAPRRLHAQMKVSVPKREGYVVHMPDVVQVFGQWPNGLAGSLEWSGVAQFPPDETLTIYGRDGTLVYNFTKDEILGARRGEKELHPALHSARTRNRWTVEKDFIDAVVQRRPSRAEF
jgi:predicted dehydrogenase